MHASRAWIPSSHSDTLSRAPRLSFVGARVSYCIPLKLEPSSSSPSHHSNDILFFNTPTPPHSFSWALDGGMTRGVVSTGYDITVAKVDASTLETTMVWATVRSLRSLAHNLRPCTCHTRRSHCCSSHGCTDSGLHVPIPATIFIQLCDGAEHGLGLGAD